MKYRQFYNSLTLFLFWLVTLTNEVQANPIFKSRDHSYKAVTIADELHYPWSMVFLTDRTILVAEKSGNIVKIQSNGHKQVVGVIKDAVFWGQGGLMDLTLHPGFGSNSLVYYSYTAEQDGEYGTRVGQFTWQGERVKHQKEIFRADNLANGSRHFGSRLVFDKMGHLYLCLGDRGHRAQSQNLDNHFGKVLRLKDSGRPAADNPFRQNPHIYSYGHRNPQGFIFVQGKLWMHEHGAKGGDELNLLRIGHNYGWPIISYGKHYSGLKIGEGTHKRGMEQPLVYWDPSIAPSGMIMYQGNKFPKWRGDIFIGALAGRHLRRIDMQGDYPSPGLKGQEVLLNGIGRVREVGEDVDGYIYVLLDAINGRLIKLESINEISE